LLPCDANLPIGVMEGWQFTLQQATIEHGTTIFLYTDGLNEAENIRHEQFGDERIMALAKKQLAKNGHQPACMIGEMTTAVQQFVGDAEQSDDLTMLAIQYKGGADGADPTCGSNKATDCSGSADGASGS
jgi:sigma-B regulation protein RsbU (phosphoserine phosphatase)